MKQFLKYFIFFLIYSLFFASCKDNIKQSTEKIDDIRFDTIPLIYAKGFEINIFENITKLTIKKPWQKAENLNFSYYLIKNNDTIPEQFKNQAFIKTPVNRIICFSTTHLAFIDVLKKNHTIVGLAGTKYVYNKEIREQITQNNIQDVGYDQNINYELILSLEPDVVFLYGIEADISSRLQKFRDLGIQTILVPEYLEDNALAKTEWIKFFALFLDKYDEAEQIFNQIEEQYIALKKLTDTISKKPKILVNVPYQGIWYLPGGNSYLAKMINDAGGNYIWKENTENESFAISIEEIFARASDADILINPGIYSKISEINILDSRLQKFKPLITKQIYNNNKRVNLNGGNDFWEYGVLTPHLILKDLINIFHQNIFFKDSLFFYKKLE